MLLTGHLSKTNMKKFYLHTPELPGWDFVFAEMVTKMAVSGMIDAIDEIHICVNGNQENMMFLLGPLTQLSSKFIIRQVHSDATKWEWPTIDTIRNDCLADDGQRHYIGYGHLKGLSRQNLQDQRATDWRHYLSYWTIERWAENFKQLDSGCETVGINWLDEPWPHYSGNFWWATSQYIKTLDALEDPATMTEPYQSRFCTTRLLPKHEFRLECEAWIGAGGQVQRHELHASPGKPNFMFHYYNTYAPENYRED